MGNHVQRNSNYSIGEAILNCLFLLRSKILIPKSRLIRFPVVIRGKRYINFGENLTTGRYCRIEVIGDHTGKRLIIGKDVNIGDYVSIRCAARIIIGDSVLIGSKVLIVDNSHGDYSGEEQDSPYKSPNERKLKVSPIEIGDNVWIGEGAIIQQGVSVGAGSIIGSNSVVTKSIPSNSIVGGVPARIIKQYSDSEKRWVKYE